MVKRISAFPLSISPNVTQYSTRSNFYNGEMPYSEFETSSLANHSNGSKNMLFNQKEFLQRQRALDQQPASLDQAYIMRAHQTAIAGPRAQMHADPYNLSQPHKLAKQGMIADLPFNAGLFPDVKNKPGSGVFQGENLIDYNFNTNENQQWQKDGSKQE